MAYIKFVGFWNGDSETPAPAPNPEDVAFGIKINELNSASLACDLIDSRFTVKIGKYYYYASIDEVNRIKRGDESVWKEMEEISEKERWGNIQNMLHSIPEFGYRDPNPIDLEVLA